MRRFDKSEVGGENPLCPASYAVGFVTGCCFTEQCDGLLSDGKDMKRYFFPNITTIKVGATRPK